MLMTTALAGSPVETALKTELDRSMAGLKLPDAPAPYLIQYDLLDGDVTTTQTSFGLLVSQQTEDYRNLRTEVRVGSYTVDSSNFSAFGEPDGISSRRLPIEDSVLAIRREVWLATDMAYKAAVEQLSRKQAARGSEDRPRPPDYTRTPPVSVGEETLPPVRPVDPAWMRSLTEKLSGTLREFPNLETAEAVSRDWQGRRLTLSSEGLRIWRSTGFTVIRVEGVIRLADGSRHRDTRSWVARSPDQLPPEGDMVAAVREMGQWLTGLQDAAVEEDYLGPVLFEGNAATELFSQLLPGEMIGTPPVEEEPNNSGISPRRAPAARLGRRLLPVGWSVVDDPKTNLPVLGAYTYDYEGVEPQRVEVIHDGVVRNLLMSRIPTKEHPQSNGHGRSLGNERRAGMPGVVTVSPPRSVSIRALHHRALQLARQVGRDYVLVVREIESPTVVEDLDIAITGDAPLPGLTHPFEVYRLYRDGRRVPVRSMEFVGVDRRLLRDIDRAGPMLGPTDVLDGPPGPERFTLGPTGGIGVTWTVPSVLVTEVELVARRGGEPRILRL